MDQSKNTFQAGKAPKMKTVEELKDHYRIMDFSGGDMFITIVSDALVNNDWDFYNKLIAKSLYFDKSTNRVQLLTSDKFIDGDLFIIGDWTFDPEQIDLFLEETRTGTFYVYNAGKLNPLNILKRDMVYEILDEMEDEDIDEDEIDFNSEYIVVSGFSNVKKDNIVFMNNLQQLTDEFKWIIQLPNNNYLTRSCIEDIIISPTIKQIILDSRDSSNSKIKGKPRSLNKNSDEDPKKNLRKS